MIAVTIGVGEKWLEAAKVAAKRVQEMTGIKRFFYITGTGDHDVHPSWMKLKIPEIVPDEDSFLYFDSDILMMRKWDVRGMFAAMGRPFMAVPDVRSAPVLAECQAFGIPFPDWYINAGLFVFGREHAPILDVAWEKRPKFGTWLEQTALNHALLHSGAEVCRLPRTFNTLLWPGHDDYSAEALRARPEIVLHAASLGGDALQLLEIQRRALDSTPLA